MESINKYIDEIMEMIADNELEEAMKELKDLTKGSPEFSKIIHASSRFNDVMDQALQGTIDFENANLEKNGIRFALIKIVNELYDNQDLNPKMVKDVDEYVAERASKINTINTSGDGNINIQDISDGNVSINIGK